MSKTYFASDFHLGTPNYEHSLAREKRIVDWLESITTDAERLILLGDVFDFWFEYKNAIPKYYTRLLGKLAQMSDQGIEILFFKGNHDMWTFGYLQKEIGLRVVDEELTIELYGKKCFIHHGDALGPGDFSYKLIRKVFRSRWASWLFHRLHPNLGIGLASLLSRRSRSKNAIKDQIKMPVEDEFQVQFVRKLEKESHFDLYIFGHRHVPMNIEISENCRLVNLGDWVTHFSFAVMDQNGLHLKTYNN